MDLHTLIARSRSLGNIPLADCAIAFESLAQALEVRATAFPDKPCIVYYDDHGDRIELSYGDFLTRVLRTVAFLQEIGVRPGTRVGVLGYNHPDTVVQLFAIWYAGATAVPINPAEDDDKVFYILTHARVSVIFIRSEYTGLMSRVERRLPSTLTIVHAGHVPPPEGWSDFNAIALHPHTTTRLAATHGRDTECLIVYTSGTTGSPKGVVLGQANLLVDALGIAEWHDINSSSTMMCVLPIHHVNGIVVTLVTPILLGATIVLNRKFQSSSFFQRIAQERVAIVSVVPTLLAFLLQADIDIGTLDLSAFRHVICGAGPLTCELAERFWRRYRKRIVHGYGLSETTCYSSFLPCDLSDADYHAWISNYGFPSIGTPIPQNEMNIHTSDGTPLGPGERGEIVIRGHTVMQGYYNDNHANHTAFANGWFRSGDEGFYERDNRGRSFFFITGRLKELIIRGGVNISPLEIDEVLNTHPGIKSAIAVGFDNSWYGDEIGALVLKSDPALTEADVISWCLASLPFYKSPKVVVFGHDIPVTSTGKYQRNRVRHLFSEYRETQFHQFPPA